MTAIPYARSSSRNVARACAAGLFLLLSAVAGAQGNLGFLRDSPMAYFNAEDTKLMRAAGVEVLNSSQAGTTKEWSNPATGNSGVIKLLASFAAPDGRACKQVEIGSQAKKMTSTSKMSVCKGADGRWKLDTVQPPQ
jgi:surface antigen